jgi:hypothetical protein
MEPLELYQYLKENFTYDANTGDLYHAYKEGSKKSGKCVGTISPNGYKGCKIKYKCYYLHRLVYIYHNKFIPEGYFVDHINHDRTNNRIENLSLIKPSENSKKKLKASGFKNVGRYSKDNRLWSTKISFGPFETPEEAETFRKNVIKLIPDQEKILIPQS